MRQISFSATYSPEMVILAKFSILESAIYSPPLVILAKFSMLESATMRCLRLDVEFDGHLILSIYFSYKTFYMKPTIPFR